MRLRKQASQLGFQLLPICERYLNRRAVDYAGVVEAD